jgi:hypothetical protein
MDIRVLVDIRDQYQNLLGERISDCIYDGFMEMYDKTGESGARLAAFQLLMKEVRNWNMDKITAVTQGILAECPFYEKLLQMVFVTNAKVLTSYEGAEKLTLELVVPSSTTFTFHVYKNAAREIFKNPQIFDQEVPPRELQDNMVSIYNIIKKAVDKTVGQLFPHDQILTNFSDYFQGSVPKAGDTYKPVTAPPKPDEPEDSDDEPDSPDPPDPPEEPEESGPLSGDPFSVPEEPDQRGESPEPEEPEDDDDPEETRVVGQEEEPPKKKKETVLFSDAEDED